MNNQIFFKNKKAKFEYILLNEYVAGIVLLGPEIKSIRQGNLNFSDSYCSFKGNELFVKNLNISEYKFATIDKYDPQRERKLLLTKRELKKLKEKTFEKGLTIIPVSVFVNDKGLAKINIALAKGKHLYDKRESIKTREVERKIKTLQF